MGVGLCKKHVSLYSSATISTPAQFHVHVVRLPPRMTWVAKELDRKLVVASAVASYLEHIKYDFAILRWVFKVNFSKYLKHHAVKKQLKMHPKFQVKRWFLGRHFRSYKVKNQNKEKSIHLKRFLVAKACLVIRPI